MSCDQNCRHCYRTDRHRPGQQGAELPRSYPCRQQSVQDCIPVGLGRWTDCDSASHQDPPTPCRFAVDYFVAVGVGGERYSARNHLNFGHHCVQMSQGSMLRTIHLLCNHNPTNTHIPVYWQDLQVGHKVGEKILKFSGLFQSHKLTFP